jgi:hypothetical protein
MKLLYGFGINDANYVVQVKETIGYVEGERRQRSIWRCHFYQKWVSMLERCYSKKYQERSPTYIGCTVCEDWLTFSNFKVWMEKQDWEDKQLDKDILFPGNKEYGPETCVFVSQQVNSFVIDRAPGRGNWPTGVSWNKAMQKFKASCCNPFTRKQEHLGYFARPDEAHQVWLTRKRELVKMLAEEQSDSRVSKALLERYVNPLDNTVFP